LLLPSELFLMSSRLTEPRLLEIIGFSGKVNMIEITREMAQQLVEFVSGETGYNMIVCDTRGVIIGDSSRERLGCAMRWRRHAGGLDGADKFKGKLSTPGPPSPPA
jgi:hypothetical protein